MIDLSGKSAVVQRSRHGRGILSSFMRSDGTLAELLYRPAGGATVPMSEGSRPDFRTDSRAVVAIVLVANR